MVRILAAIGVVAVLAVVATINLVGLGEVRRAVVEPIPLEIRHVVIAQLSLFTDREPWTDDLVPIAHAGLNPYAVNVFLEQEVEEEKIRRSLRMIRDAGFRYIEQQLLWAEVELPAKGGSSDVVKGVDDSWLKYDRIVDLAREHNLEVIYRIDTSPPWARPGRDKLETPPDNPQDFADFVGRVVERYKGKVRFYQLWNEPNLSFEWGGQRPDPAGYTKMLKLASIAAKRADPASIIIAASLAPTIETSERAFPDVDYLEAMYDAGAGDYFDVLSVNAYGLRRGPDDRRMRNEVDVGFSRPALIREVMVRNGDSGKPIFASEIGWNALPPDFPDEQLYGRVSPATQAAYTLRAYQRAQEEWPWMGIMALWQFRMPQPDSDKLQHYYFSLVAEDFEPQPIYQAISQFTLRQPALHRGYHQEDHWAIDWTDDWDLVPDANSPVGGYRQTKTPGARLWFDVVGGSLWLVTAGSGQIAVSVDGLPAKVTFRQMSADGRGVFRRGPTRGRLLIVDGMSSRRHRVEISVLSVGDEGLSIDGLIVYGPTTKIVHYQRLAGLLVGLSYIAVIGWLALRRRRKHVQIESS